MSKKRAVVYVSSTGKEYVKMYGNTYKCCRKNTLHPDNWIWIASVNRWICPIPY